MIDAKWQKATLPRVAEPEMMLAMQLGFVHYVLGY